MLDLPEIGRHALRRSDTLAWAQYEIQPVRDLNSLQKVIALRAMTFMAEQACPFKEEFDGNDLNATHLILSQRDGEAVATVRLRWFAQFAKVERVCVIPSERGSDAVKVLLAHAFELISRKGYVLAIAQIQARLVPFWLRILNCSIRSDRAPFEFSEFEYREIDIPLPAHPQAIRVDCDPYVMIRPEGAWDERGVLESSPTRTVAA